MIKVPTITIGLPASNHNTKPTVNAVLPNNQGTVVTPHPLVANGRSSRLPSRPKVTVTKPTRADAAPKAEPTKRSSKLVDNTRTSQPAQAQLPIPSTQAPPRTVKCVLCHTLMTVSATKQAAHGGFQCVSRKGCDERKAQREVEQGGKALAESMTPKESALAKLGGSETPNGMRIVTPAAKELKSAGIDPAQPLVRVTDEEEPALEEARTQISKAASTASEESQAQTLIWRMVERFGATFIMRETMMAEGITTLPLRLVALIMENTENGSLSGEGHMAVLAELAKMAKSQDYKTLAFYEAQAYFNESGVRIPGF